MRGRIRQFFQYSLFLVALCLCGQAMARSFEDAPIVEIRILDKVRAESRTYELAVGRTVAYANLRIRPRACRSSSPLDEPENAAFMQIWEIKPDKSSAWVFSGWMFASSPSLSAMDHPVYDIWVMNCRDPQKQSRLDMQEITADEDVVFEELIEDMLLEGSDESMSDTPVDDSAVESLPR